MWPSRLRLPALRWSAVRYASTRSRTSPRGPRNSLRRREFPQPISVAKRQAGAQPASGNLSPDNPAQTDESLKASTLSSTLHDTDPKDNSLLAPVHIPEDPNGVLKERHPAAKLLSNSGLVVQRQLEMMNVMLGFEQANRYVIYDGSGNHVGYMAEQESGMGSVMLRQLFRSHRSFVAHVFDKHENEVLRFYHPMTWLNSRIRVYDPLEVADSSYSSSTAIQEASAGPLVHATPGASARVSSLDLSEMRIIGETQQQWAFLRRKYNLFLHRASPSAATDLETHAIQSPQASLSKSQQLQVSKGAGPHSAGEYGQFAYVDEPFLSWDFSLRSVDSRLIGSVNRNFAGFAREIFTDTGVYALRMDAAGLAEEQARRGDATNGSQASATLYDDNKTAAGMTLDQRAVMLATAVNIDFDYFSRHSGGMGFAWLPVFDT
ncbi:hypothetical protein FQN54_005381 [Arachnomyces sp. PD_36]|nr:hypothetical protein FQN54_005381 [Arachnomyces sp. PD_36]